MTNVGGPDDPNNQPSGTIPAPPPSEAPLSEPMTPIPHGEAQLALSRTLGELTRAVLRVERIAMAFARALDTTPKVTP